MAFQWLRPRNPSNKSPGGPGLPTRSESVELRSALLMIHDERWSHNSYKERWQSLVNADNPKEVVLFQGSVQDSRKPIPAALICVLITGHA
jgi:hypothetical protein